MNERTGFLFFRSYYEALRDLDDNIRHQIYDAIFEYIFEDKLPSFDGVQNACFKLIKPTLDKSKAQYENGKKNGKKNSKDKTNQKPSESQTEAYKDKEYDTDNDMEYDIDKDIPAPASPSSKSKSTDLLFTRFWNTYPKRKGKDNALKAFIKLKADESLLDTMLKAIDQQSRSDEWQKDNGQFIPYPATWLNGRRWEDEETNTKPDYSNISRYEGMTL